MATLIPVRKLDEAGYIFIRFLTPEGTKPEGDISDHKTPDIASLNITHPITITALWDPQYQLGSQRQVMEHNTFSNLLYLSDTDPLLFEKLLVRLETCSREESSLWKRRLMDYATHPKTSQEADTYYFSLYHQMLKVVPVASTLGMNSEDGSTLINAARDIVQSLHHEHLTAAVLCYWILATENSFLTPKISYRKCQDDIAFVHENIDAVMGMRHELKRLRTFDRAVLSEMLNGASVLNDGYI